MISNQPAGKPNTIINRPTDSRPGDVDFCAGINAFHRGGRSADSQENRSLTRLANPDNLLRLNTEQPAGFFVTRGAKAVFVFAVVTVSTCADAGQPDELPPAERRSNRPEFFADGMVVLLAVQPAILAH